ncbi:MAG: antibiotic biosynthesis monooxygenase [Phenylobacterium sp.]|uniref:putative quinol monooxygenase n=1 Tax=Phenylobacterium sp. TaxID=1871053 RepID=UPI00121704FD|nr:putative quinol monooxygenase [Phenylobacterium sp.]TAJ73211.1 MAG: antibiotic biosynthesis monooxygenase [Phenylobacterium sp.]
MLFERRTVIAGAAAAALAGPAAAAEGATMYGLIGKMLAQPGQRDALVRLLLEGAGAMPGCLSYVVATDPANPDAIWITEAWDSPESHAGSLRLPSVQATIAKARPLIAGFGERFETHPVGGLGLLQPSGKHF